ncbi:hypothetical protein DPMN_103681 [Dreissena polymorpha]|uniref:Uncharacterized protein n=1 Tax=Dreissena polymorpha TaxID=45954 RepID=A0A9D4K2G2_DREPO|nr:hypothetical protein DPMN_103681 [Dreissena polymorpha]
MDDPGETEKSYSISLKDKLHIDESTFTVDKLPPNPAPELPPRRFENEYQHATKQTNNRAPRLPQVASYNQQCKPLKFLVWNVQGLCTKLSDPDI